MSDDYEACEHMKNTAIKITNHKTNTTNTGGVHSVTKQRPVAFTQSTNNFLGNGLRNHLSRGYHSPGAPLPDIQGAKRKEKEKKKRKKKEEEITKKSYKLSGVPDAQMHALKKMHQCAQMQVCH